MTPAEVLETDYRNLLLYSLAMPRYNNKKKDKKPTFDASLDANDPNNFKDTE